MGPIIVEKSSSYSLHTDSKLHLGTHCFFKQIFDRFGLHFGGLASGESSIHIAFFVDILLSVVCVHLGLILGLPGLCYE